MARRMLAPMACSDTFSSTIFQLSWAADLKSRSWLEMAAQSSIATIPIVIKTLAGDLISLDVAPSVNILQVKRMIAASAAQFSVHLQQLIFMEHSDQPLSDFATLQSVDIEADSMLMLIINDNSVAPGTFIRSFDGVAGGGTSKFAKPAGIAVNHTHHILMAVSSGNHCIQAHKLDKDMFFAWRRGQPSVSGNGPMMLSSPFDCVHSLDGESVFVSDTGNCRVVKLKVSDGAFQLSFGSRGAGPDPLEFDSPSGLALTAFGGSERLWLADANNRRLLCFDTLPQPPKLLRQIGGDGVPVSVAGAMELSDEAKAEIIGSPVGLAVHRDRLFMVDSLRNRVLVFDERDGTLLRILDSFEPLAGRPGLYVPPDANKGFKKRFSRPQGVAVSGTYFYVVDMGNKRVCVFQIETFDLVGIMDASSIPRNVLSFTPAGVCVDEITGQVWISDHGHSIKAFKSF